MSALMGLVKGNPPLPPTCHAYLHGNAPLAHAVVALVVDGLVFPEHALAWAPVNSSICGEVLALPR